MFSGGELGAAFAPFFIKVIAVVVALIGGAFALGAWLF